MSEVTTITVGECPKCKWRTRELEPAEIEEVKQGRIRCSGQCHGGQAAIDLSGGGRATPVLKIIEIPAPKE